MHHLLLNLLAVKFFASKPSLTGVLPGIKSLKPLCEYSVVSESNFSG